MRLNVAEYINPAFDPVLFSPKTHIVCKGGRGSTKSSVISLRIVIDFLRDPQANAVILRKVGKYLRMSVYEQIKWAIYTLGKAREFEFYKSPLQIVHKTTGTGFYFYGVDDPMKLKSQKIAKGYVSQLWFEELAEFDGREDIDIVEDTYIREELPGDKVVRVFFSYNPPKNPYDWVNEWVEEKRGDSSYLIHHSTFKDDVLGFLSKQMKDKIFKAKETDPEYYRWMYEGEAIGLGTHIYNMAAFKPLTELPSDEPVIGLCFSLDPGHQQSATACESYGITSKGNVILLDTFYYSPAGRSVKKAPSELTVMLHGFIDGILNQFPGIGYINYTIDSAEGALRNQYFHDYQVNWHPVAKKKKQTMIDLTLSLLAEGRFYYLDKESNQVFIEEHKMYRYEEDSINSPDPKVVKESDHTCDGFQYFCVDNAKVLGLKA